MKRKIQIVILISLLLGLNSCSKNYKIDRADYSLIPYSGKEILILKSSKNKLDTIFLKGIERYQTGTDPLAFFPDQIEIHTLFSKRSDPNYDRYLEGDGIIQLRASPNGTSISFGITMKESWFYGKRIYSRKEFDSIPMTKLAIENKTYDDVKTIESDGSYINRDNYAERFYWSIKDGFLGLDKKDEKWRLIKKYIP